MSSIRAVLDTQLFLRAAINRRSLPAKIIFDLREKYTLVASRETSAEVAEVLSRPSLRLKFKTLTDEISRELLTILESADQTVIDEVAAISRDPKDDIFLACAKAAGAQYLVTEDKDLLVLNPYDGIQIINALDFLRVLQPPADGQPDTE